jgi:hypothetical protein
MVLVQNFDSPVSARLLCWRTRFNDSSLFISVLILRTQLTPGMQMQNRLFESLIQLLCLHVIQITYVERDINPLFMYPTFGIDCNQAEFCLQPISTEVLNYGGRIFAHRRIFLASRPLRMISSTSQFK